MSYTYKRISELEIGDIVVTHGMRCEIDRPIEVSKVHGLGSDGSHCRYTKALVLNRDEVNLHMVPWSFTADWKRDAKFEDRPHDGEHRWSIQSNDLITWAVEDK
jgi:hypothetical protein